MISCFERNQDLKKKKEHLLIHSATFVETTKMLINVISETTSNYCKESTMHGLKNVITDYDGIRTSTSKSSKTLKSFSFAAWIIVCILSLFFGLLLMHLVYERFSTTPTITTIETNHYRNWNVHFPAITICDINKVHRPAAEPIIQMLEEMGLNRSRVTKFFSQLSKLVEPVYINDVFEEILDSLTEANYTTERLMFEVMRPCVDMFRDCMWLGVKYPCQNLFHVATGSEGFCCSFNYIPSLDPQKISTEQDFIEDTIRIPYRASGAGPSAGLDVVIDVSKEDYVSYSETFYGVSIYVHSFNEFPQPADKMVIAQPSTDVLIAVEPTVLSSAKNFRKLPLFLRNCYFEDEEKLRTSIEYTYQSCISECAVNATIKACNCVPFYYPEVHLRENIDQIRQCTLRDVNCLRENQIIFNSLQPDDVNETIGLNCENCLPSCSAELFGVHTVTSVRTENDSLKSTRHPGLDLKRFIELGVYYKDMSCIKYRRDIFMTWDTLFGSLGGILGLCMGGSVISLVEFIYFFTFKLLKNLISYRWRYTFQVQPLHDGKGAAGKAALRQFRHHNLPLHPNGVNIGRRDNILRF